MDRVDVIQGGVTHLDRSDVDTDQIIPKQFLKRVEKDGYGEFLFYDWRKNGEIQLEKNPILIAGKNFGSGSSREHAVWALRDFGFQAVIAPSFSDIFYSNCLQNGFLAIRVNEEFYAKIKNASQLRIDLDEQTVTGEFGVERFLIEEENKRRLLLGLDSIEVTLESKQAIDRFEEERSPLLPRTR